MDPVPHTEIVLRKQAALISLGVGLLMLLMKSAAYVLTNSSAIFSDALESVVHVGATGMALFSVILSARPADRSHPYGHGKVEFFSAGIEGGLIVLAAFAIIYQASLALIVGRDLVQLDVGLLLTLVASVVNLLLGAFLVRRGKQTSSLTLIADGKHVLTDSYTSFGVVAGVGLVMATGITILDPLVAIAVAVNIIVSGYKLMRVSVSGLMDESDQDTLESVAAIINRERKPEWINIHHLRVLRSGGALNVDFHLTIPFYWSVERAHRFHHHVTDRIAAGLGNDANVMVHIDPCTPSCCPLCQVDPCTERREAFRREPSWSAGTLIGEAPYVRSPAGTEDATGRMP
jgi:cation diffusion facilitator family transporter